MSDGGKGSAPRKNRDDDAYAKNWENIFGKKSKAISERKDTRLDKSKTADGLGKEKPKI